MFFLLSVRTKSRVIDAKDAVINCPACKRQGVAALVFEQERIELLYGLIPVTKTIRAGVECGRCKRVFYPNEKFGVLALLNREELSDLLTTSSSIRFVAKFVIVVSLLLFCMPFVSFAMAVIGFLKVRNTPSGWRTAAIVAMTLSGFVTFFSLLVIVVNALASGQHHP